MAGVAEGLNVWPLMSLPDAKPILGVGVAQQMVY